MIVGTDQAVGTVQDFCDWMGGRLPSESEWEYAARSGGHNITYPWGNAEATCEYAVMADNGVGCGMEQTWEVCSKPAGNSDQGLCDLSGNVWEWVQDWYHDSYDVGVAAPDDGSAGEDPAGSQRAGRGGCLLRSSSLLRATQRGYGYPDRGFIDTGFRCARRLDGGRRNGS